MLSRKEYERKLREDQEAAAHVFQDFITTFQDTSGAPVPKTFIKCDTLNPASKTASENSASIESCSQGQLYKPSPVIKSENMLRSAIECARILKPDKCFRKKLAGGQKMDKPKSNLEQLKEEIKLRHAERVEREKIKEESGLAASVAVTPAPTAVCYFEGGDPNSTNLFIANLSTQMTENDLMLLFGQYGPLASVKIMWPRVGGSGEDRRSGSNGTNCGFVAFMSRKDAERALKQLKGRSDMRVGWGKSVDLPSHPVYIPPEMLKKFLPPPPSGLPFNAQPLHASAGGNSPCSSSEIAEILEKSVVYVTIPLNRKVLTTINRTIEFVVREGPLFEAAIMNRELNNPDYNFLFDYKSQDHVYYRWKLFSILQGDGLRNWSTKPFRMYKSGAIWVPPIAPDFQKGYEEVQAKNSDLSDAQFERLVGQVRDLTPNRRKVAEAMVFCINHATYINNILDVLVDSLRSYQTHPFKKLARVYLLADVLHNCKMKKINAQIADEDFVAIFKNLNHTVRGFKYQLDKENFELRVTKLLRFWDITKVIPVDLIAKLERTFAETKEQENDDDSSGDDRPLDGDSLLKRSRKCNQNSTDVIIPPAPSWSNNNKAIKTQNSAEENSAPDIISCFVPSKWDEVDPEEIEANSMSTEKLYYLELERKIEEKELKRRKKIETKDKKVKIKKKKSKK